MEEELGGQAVLLNLVHSRCDKGGFYHYDHEWFFFAGVPETKHASTFVDKKTTLDIGIICLVQMYPLFTTPMFGRSRPISVSEVISARKEF